MATRSDESVPSWDGQAKNWRRYTKEVAWFVASTPTKKRRYVASKLISRLSGPARLLAMSWSRTEFDSPDGTLNLLKKLAGSPLVRKTLPNTAAILQQYLGFRRQSGESMANFLVRETLGYEEFSEALIRLWEEQTGIDPAERNFGLPPISEWDWWDDDYEYGYMGGMDVTTGDAEHQHDPAATAAAAASPEQGAEPPVSAAPGSSPSHRVGAASEHSAPGPVSDPGKPKIPQDVSEVSLADSFIMGVLRGWRLLKAASLTPEETRDILSTTQNKLDFEAISQALSALWDEQLLGHRYSQHAGRHGSSNNALWHEWHDDGWDDGYEINYDEMWTWGNDDGWWNDGQYHDEWHEHEWPDETSSAKEVQTTLSPDEEERLQDALQAEQVAEQLAAEARRTWQEAQKTTQQLKRDRGFGQVNTVNNGRCFNCGGNHLVRDCPDRRHGNYPKGKFSGKGKGMHYMIDPIDTFFQNKGKGKKGKSKFSHMSEQEMFWSSKGKSPYHSKDGNGKGFSKNPVNAYALSQQSCSSSSTTSSPLKHDREELLRKLFRCGRNMAGKDHRGGEAEQQSSVPAGKAQRRELLEGSKVQGSLKECGEEDGCHHGLHGPELTDDKSFRQQLGSDFGFTRSSQPGGLPDRTGKDRLAQPGAYKKGDDTTRRSHPHRGKPMTSSSLPLTTTMGSKVMKMVTRMTATMSHLALQIAMDGRECLWEIACADNSWLTQAALNHGLPARRINYKQGFDLYKKSAWMEMERLRKIKRPKKLWLSLPCTHWCQWTNVNYNTDERKAVLEDLRRRDRRMMHYAKDFILNAVDDDPGIDVYWEWTFPCSGWSQPPMVSLQHGLLQRGQSWERCRIDGCNYGMRNSDDSAFIRKRWEIRTNDELFHRNFKCKVCPRNHQHALIQGIETARSAYYPVRMVEAIVRHWKNQLAPQRHVQALTSPDAVVNSKHAECDVKWTQRLQALPAEEVLPPVPDDGDLSDGYEPSILEAPQHGDDVNEQERQEWHVKLQHYHRAAGHPTNKNLIHLFRDAGLPKWKIEMARDLRCDACDRLLQGSKSSGEVPRASTHPLCKAWEIVGADSSEWHVPEQKIKIKFILLIDFATKLRAVHVVKSYGLSQLLSESSEDVIKAIAEKWLADKPKPRLIVPDNSSVFTATDVNEFLTNVGIQLSLPAEKESWAHGLVESAIKDVKMTASAIQLGQPTLPPGVSLQLACAALNSTEYTKGYSSFQWCYGKDYTITDEEIRTFDSLPDTTKHFEYEALVRARQGAEEVARRTRALRVMSKLKNSSVKQPLRTFEPMDLVMVWRKQWPAHLLAPGRRGGFQRSIKPHWIGPGRVVFHEVLHHQEEGDERRHILWVLVGSQLLRCSAHSVRPVTDTERVTFEVCDKQDVTKWKSLADVLPQREYLDITDQVPGEDERESPDLPDQPDESTAVPAAVAKKAKKVFQKGVTFSDPALQPRSKIVGKKSLTPDDWKPKAGDDDVELLPEPGSASQPAALEPAASNSPDLEELLERDVNDYDVSPRPLPDPKKQKINDDKDMRTLLREQHSSQYDLKWVEELHQPDDGLLDFYNLVVDNDLDCLSMQFDLDFVSNRQFKNFLRSPTAYLVKKMRDSEVVLSKLSPQHRELFARAKGKEIDSFLKNEAVKACHRKDEVREAMGSGRIVRARWVLTWKLVPPEDQDEARQDASTNPSSTHTSDGLKKAKARIVLLGFEHPEIGNVDYKTSSPVQSMLARNLLYQATCQHSWQLEGLDLATAFLQTAPTSADANLWTYGVAELRSALGLDTNGIMKVMRNIYGSTTAPRGLWLDLHKTLTGLGGYPALGERCLWVWYDEDPETKQPFTIGMMGGHVDDFHRTGDSNNAKWNEVCRKIDAAYRWGTAKHSAYRHAGTDVQVKRDNDGDLVITVNQQYYVDSLPDLDISADRLRQEDARMTSHEIAACRGALGTLQWLAIQTQPQLCARCNLLLTEVIKFGKMSYAMEIQRMIGEIRRESYELKFFKHKTAKTWRDVCFITMADQAHANRDKGDSTGGIITLMSGPEALKGEVCPMSLLAWRTWKLLRKALGSNDAEVQAVLEGEDWNFRARLLWCEIHGAGLSRPRDANKVEFSEEMVKQVEGLLCTDSKGGFDAVLYNESPLLGLSNTRSALQALQLREYLQRAGSKLRWVASDYDLGDSLTKKRPDCRVGLQKFLKTWLWAVKYDPQFIASKKNKKEGKTAINQIDDYLSGKPDLSFYAGATDPCQVRHFDFMFDHWPLSAMLGSGGAPFL